MCVNENNYQLLLLTPAILMISSPQWLDKQPFQKFDEKKNSEEVTGTGMFWGLDASIILRAFTHLQYKT